MSKTDVKRNEKIVALYRQGKTLQELGDVHGICREAVRLVLKAAGLNRKDGGQAQRARTRLAKKNALRDEKYMKWRGMGFDEFQKINKENISANGNSPSDAYSVQERNARYRGISWEMNFAVWWKCWYDSGRWKQRGRGGGYVMARYDDTGPYHPDNIEIITAGENQSDFINRYWREVRSGIRPLPKNIVLIDE